jgi:Galactocerebrosidase, C-terminal lectin domain
MTLMRALSTVIALLLVILPISSEAQVSAPIRIDLSKAEPGQEPADFSVWRTGQGEAARWIVVGDPTASQGRALAQVSTDRTDYRFPLAVYQPFTGKNLEVKLRFKAVAGTVDEAGGIAVRLKTPDDYYVVRANALENNVRFYRVVKGKREQLAGVDTKVSAKEWHTLGIRAEGERFTVSFDGKLLFTASDKTFADPGNVGLWTKADSVTHFDAIEITPLP